MTTQGVKERSYTYEHTQTGTYIRFGLGLPLIVVVCLAIRMLTIAVEAAAAIIFGLIAVILVACIALFHSLRVRVSRSHIELSFGIGLIRKRFDVNDIQSATIVRNRWYHGWGVRYFGRGPLYNVSGLDAVEIQLKSGRKARIGTDEPRALLSAIESVT